MRDHMEGTTAASTVAIVAILLLVLLIFGLAMNGAYATVDMSTVGGHISIAR
jgi:hypothetical protein